MPFAECTKWEPYGDLPPKSKPGISLIPINILVINQITDLVLVSRTIRQIVESELTVCFENVFFVVDRIEMIVDPVQHSAIALSVSLEVSSQ